MTPRPPPGKPRTPPAVGGDSTTCTKGQVSAGGHVVIDLNEPATEPSEQGDAR